MIKYYILVDKVPVPSNLMEWGKWMLEKPLASIIKKTPLNYGIEVSTVFLGVDHNFQQEGPPLLFETMIFGGPQDGYKVNYTSYQDAVEGHEKNSGFDGIYTEKLSGSRPGQSL